MQQSLAEIAVVLTERFHAHKQEAFGQTQVVVPVEQIIACLQALRDEFGFEMLSDITAVDYYPEASPRFHVIYQVRDVRRHYLLTLRVPVNGVNPTIATAETIYPNANWLEREIWDMFGIRFEGHSDMRRILMPADWQGHPLRKDYPLGYEEIQYTFNVNQVELRKPRPKE